jgi:hypothetical protein
MEARKDSMGPWRVGWESIKANWLPMVVLWLLVGFAGAFWSLVGLSSGIRLARSV